MSILEYSNSSGSTGSYGIMEGIFEGIRVEINGVVVTFISSAFSATLQIQQILVFSAKQNWTAALDLRESRVKSEKEIVSRKKIQWASVRIEATWKDAGKLYIFIREVVIRYRRGPSIRNNGHFDTFLQFKK